ncbi:acetyl-CoA carboxylase carboxyl transferase subunit beta [candidate division KSB1 bacterium]|nr:MAG: acetyl-CoA carboxylase carboxyl transferase subunit beta [candidate division KSB1 bacterium]
MAWFKRTQKGVTTTEKKQLPDGLWLKCEQCNEILYRKELERNLYVCYKCNFHFRIRSYQYIQILLDENSFEEFEKNIKSVDPLHFRDRRRYSDRIRDAMKNSGLNEAIITGFGNIMGNRIVFGAMDFAFIGGSMGSVVGETVARATEKAMEHHLPLVIVSASGGARMMEGAISLMQMAKTSAMLAEFSKQGGLYISILTNPTTGGTTASYAMLGDIILAEPGALIGFAGPRVIKQTIGEDLPEGFQRSEFLLKHGFIDAVFSRHEMRTKLAQIIEFFSEKQKG